MIVLISRPIFIALVTTLLVAPLSYDAVADNLTIGRLSQVYEPLKFNHDKHMDIESNCAACHHHSGQETPTCSSCHGPGDQGAKKRNIAGLKGAYHGLCIGCHKKISGPAECNGCHKKKNRKLDIMEMKTISNVFAPVQFSHGRHIDAISDCALCHHQTEGNRAAPCNSCHEAATIYKYKGTDRKTGLGLKGAYHGLCVGCHKKASGPAGCNDCHQKQVK